MKELATRITEFETRYLSKLRHWTAMVGPEELDTLLRVLEQMQAESEAITADFTAQDSRLYETVWKPLLSQVGFMVPSLVAQMEKIRGKARTDVTRLDRGKHVLRGYRQTTPPKRVLFESEG